MAVSINNISIALGCCNYSWKEDLLGPVKISDWTVGYPVCTGGLLAGARVWLPGGQSTAGQPWCRLAAGSGKEAAYAQGYLGAQASLGRRDRAYRHLSC